MHNCIIQKSGKCGSAVQFQFKRGRLLNRHRPEVYSGIGEEVAAAELSRAFF